jgi:hypothetical protein
MLQLLKQRFQFMTQFVDRRIEERCIILNWLNLCGLLNNKLMLWRLWRYDWRAPSTTRENHTRNNQMFHLLATSQ